MNKYNLLTLNIVSFFYYVKQNMNILQITCFIQIHIHLNISIDINLRVLLTPHLAHTYVYYIIVHDTDSTCTIHEFKSIFSQKKSS
jgi:hypothetical protein